MTCHLIGPFLCVGGAQDLAGMWQQVATVGDLCWLQLLVLFAGLVTMGIAVDCERGLWWTGYCLPIEHWCPSLEPY